MQGGRTTDVTVEFSTGADGDLATAGQDYTAVSTTLTFAPADDTKTVTVRTTSDTRFEVPESFTVSLFQRPGRRWDDPCDTGWDQVHNHQ